MKIFVHVALVLGMALSAGAEETVQSLKAQAKEMDQKARELQNEVRKLQGEAKKLKAKAFILEKTPEIEALAEKLVAVKPKKERKVLIYSRTAGFRHGSIELGTAALTIVERKPVPLPLSTARTLPYLRKRSWLSSMALSCLTRLGR